MYGSMPQRRGMGALPGSGAFDASSLHSFCHGSAPGMTTADWSGGRTHAENRGFRCPSVSCVVQAHMGCIGVEHGHEEAGLIMEGDEKFVGAQRVERGRAFGIDGCETKQEGELIRRCSADSNYLSVLCGPPRLAGLAGVGPVSAEPRNPAPLRHDEDVLMGEGALLASSQTARDSLQGTAIPVVDFLEPPTGTVQRPWIWKAEDSGCLGWGEAVGVRGGYEHGQVAVMR